MEKTHSDSRPAYIYTLQDPDLRLVRYVGWSVNPAARLHGHMSKCRNRKSHCERWLFQLREAGKRPLLQIVEQTTLDHYAERERFWIEHYRQAGAPLTNISDGGDGAPGLKMSEETRKQMSQIARAQGRKPPLNPEIIEKRRQKALGRKDSPEIRMKKSAGRLGLRFSSEHKESLRRRKEELYQSERGRAIANSYSRAYGVLTDSQVLEVYRLAWEGSQSQRLIAERFGIPQSSVSEIKLQKRYKHVFEVAGE